MTAYRVDLDDEALQAAFRRLYQAGTDLRPLWQDFGEHLELAHEERWEAGQAPGGGGWAPLKPSTWARKRGHKPLFEEGDMLRGLVYDARATELQFGLSDEKAAWHHFGTSRGLPARELVGLSSEDRDVLTEMAVEHLKDALE